MPGPTLSVTIQGGSDMRKILIALSALLLAGCATGYGYSGYEGRGYGDYYYGGGSSYYGGYGDYYGAPHGYSSGYGGLGYYGGRGYYGGLYGSWGYPWYGGYSSWYGWPGYGYGYYSSAASPSVPPNPPPVAPLRAVAIVRWTSWYDQLGGSLRRTLPASRAGSNEAPRRMRAIPESRTRGMPTRQASPPPSQNRLRNPPPRGGGRGASLSQPPQPVIAAQESRLRQPAVLSDTRLRQPAALSETRQRPGSAFDARQRQMPAPAARLRQPAAAPTARMPAPVTRSPAAMPATRHTAAGPSCARAAPGRQRGPRFRLRGPCLCRLSVPCPRRGPAVHRARPGFRSRKTRNATQVALAPAMALAPGGDSSQARPD